MKSDLYYAIENLKLQLEVEKKKVKMLRDMYLKVTGEYVWFPKYKEE